MLVELWVLIVSFAGRPVDEDEPEPWGVICFFVTEFLRLLPAAGGSPLLAPFCSKLPSSRSSFVALFESDIFAAFCTSMVVAVTPEPVEGWRSCRRPSAIGCFVEESPAEACRTMPSTLSAAFGFIAFSFSLWLRRSVALEEALPDSLLPE